MPGSKLLPASDIQRVIISAGGNRQEYTVVGDGGQFKPPQKSYVPIEGVQSLEQPVGAKLISGRIILPGILTDQAVVEPLNVLNATMELYCASGRAITVTGLKHITDGGVNQQIQGGTTDELTFTFKTASDTSPPQ